MTVAVKNDLAQRETKGWRRHREVTLEMPILQSMKRGSMKPVLTKCGIRHCWIKVSLDSATVTGFQDVYSSRISNHILK